MKLIGTYTTRGQCPDNGKIRIPLFDGRYDTGYKVTRFIVAGVDTVSQTTTDVNGVLGTEEDAVSNQWVWSDDRQLAWASSRGIDAATVSQDFEIVDRENLVIEDLYIYANSNGGDFVNYYIEMEKYSLKDFQGVSAMVQNMAQG